MKLLTAVVFVIFFVALVNCQCGCTYTCWQVTPGSDLFAECTGTNLAPNVYINGTFIQEDCGGCSASTDRVKGYFGYSNEGNSWCWIAKSDLSGGYSCDVFVEKTQKKEARKALSCPSPGCYTPSGHSMVRGDASYDGNGNRCSCHHFLGWMSNGDHIQIDGVCESDCDWVYGYCYGEVNEICSVLADELTYTGASC